MIDTLTIVERQILTNQFKILARLEDNAEHHLVSAEIFENGYTGRYGDALNVGREETSIEVCNETEEILNMYRRIHTGIEALSEEEREGLDLDSIRFEGFDMNNDDHYFYMRFMVEKMDLWQEHNGRNLNSHTNASLRKYRAMLAHYRELMAQQNYNITRVELEQFIEII